MNDLRFLIKRFFKKWNIDPRGDQPSRQKVWKTATPQVGLAAPSPERLYHLGHVRDWKTPKVHDSHIQFNNEFYRLNHITPVSRARWRDAVKRKAPTWSLEYETLEERKVRKAYTCLDGKTFEELIPTTEQRPDARTRVKENQQDINLLKRRRSGLGAAFLRLLQEKGVDIDVTTVDTVETMVVVSSTKSGVQTTSESSTPSGGSPDQSDGGSKIDSHPPQPDLHDTPVQPTRGQRRTESAKLQGQTATGANEQDTISSSAKPRRSFVDVRREKGTQ